MMAARGQNTSSSLDVDAALRYGTFVSAQVEGGAAALSPISRLARGKELPIDTAWEENRLLAVLFFFF